MSFLSPMQIACESISFFPSSTASGVLSFNTSSWYSDFPIKAPKAMAMGRPIIPVPGMPTPMAFFNILALNSAFIFSGLFPNVSVALATQSATAIGSVHPIAGTTSRLIRAMICSLSDLAIIVLEFL